MPIHVCISIEAVNEFGVENKNPDLDNQPLCLNEQLRATASAVVQVWDSIDWSNLKKVGIDRVFLNFPDECGVKKAYDLVFLISIVNQRTVTEAASKFHSYIRRVFPSLRNFIKWRLRNSGAHKGGGKSAEIPNDALKILQARLDKSVKLYKQHLDQLNSPLSDGKVGDAWQALNRELRVVLEIQNKLTAIEVGLIDQIRRITKPLETLQSPPLPPLVEEVKIAQRGENWLIIPLQLASAPEVIEVCRRIMFCRPDFRKVEVAARLNAMVQKYSQFFLSGNFTRFEVPDEEDPRHARFLQQDLDRLLPALREFLQCLLKSSQGSISATECAGTVKEMSKKDRIKTVSKIGTVYKPPSSNEKGGWTPITGGIVEVDLGTTTSSARSGHRVSVNEKFEISADGREITYGRALWRSLLCLAAFSNDDRFMINKAAFVKAYYGSNGKDSGKRFLNLWHRLKAALPNLIDNGGRNLLLVDQVTIDKEVNHEEILKHLERNSITRPSQNK